MIATIAVSTEENVQRSYGNHFPAIVAIAATTIAEIDFSSISVIVAIAAIMWKPLSNGRSDHMETGLNFHLFLSQIVARFENG